MQQRVCHGGGGEDVGVGPQHLHEEAGAVAADQHGEQRGGHVRTGARADHAVPLVRDGDARVERAGPVGPRSRTGARGAVVVVGQQVLGRHVLDPATHAGNRCGHLHQVARRAEGLGGQVVRDERLRASGDEREPVDGIGCRRGLVVRHLGHDHYHERSVVHGLVGPALGRRHHHDGGGDGDRHGRGEGLRRPTHENEQRAVKQVVHVSLQTALNTYLSTSENPHREHPYLTLLLPPPKSRVVWKRYYEGSFPFSVH